ncbi:MAG: hypothetical protein KA004_13435 [Verrucomicrobiales bacterium]|nr:hypothetical protein [Verrucomicrobiales bacterium]
MIASYLTQTLIRAAMVVAALGIWHWTQSLIGCRKNPQAGIGDWFHQRTAAVHRWLTNHPAATDRFLIASSLAIDLCGLAILGVSIFGRTIEPFLALILVFSLRQICQGLCALPPPEGMIWRDPGFPSLLVTYGVSNDLFFSGHTALVVLAGIEAAHLGPSWLAVVAVVHAVVQAGFVLLLRAHYMLDVLAGAWAAWFAADMARHLAPWLDALTGA